MDTTDSFQNKKGQQLQCEEDNLDPQHRLENVEERRALRSLSVIEAVRLLRHHDISESVQSIIEKERVDGQMLEDAVEVDDFVGIGISKLHSKSLLRIVGEAREKGVPVSWLQQVIPAPAPAPAPALALALAPAPAPALASEAVDWNQVFAQYRRSRFLKDAASRAWLEQHAAAGNEAAKAYLMLRLWHKDMSRALGFHADLQMEALPRWLRSRDATERMHAQYILGYCSFYGLGCDQDEAQAATWYRRSADHGHADAQYRLGDCYFLGFGVPWDYKQSVSWHRNAADQGHAEAQYWLGYCYQYGKGVTRNRNHAVTWYLKAADQGYRSAISELKKMNISLA